MKIKKLTHQNVVNVTTTIHNKKYHNVKHGIRGNDHWEWSLSLDKSTFPVIDNECIVLTKNNYLLTPVYKNNRILKDKNDNVVYNLKICNMDFHSNDIILLWELPIKNFVKVTYSTSGFVTEIGLGYIGKFRNNKMIKIPSPVLEITGSAILTWIGTTNTGEQYEQVVHYDYNEDSWDILPPKMK